MKDVLELSEGEILQIPLDNPEKLFGKADLIDSLYKMLAKKWHPDHHGAGDIFAHINALRQSAKNIAENGMWRVPGELKFFADGKAYALRYFKSFKFELGDVYLSETRITYVIRKEFSDLVENAKKIIESLHYPTDEMKTVMSRYLPKILGMYRTDNDIIVMYEKPADLIRLRDLYDHLDGKIIPEHVAWMISRLLNHVSCFSWNKFAHNDLSMDTLFVCPEHHTMVVLGGWWYAAPISSKISALPRRTILNAPHDVLKNKKSSVKTDLELVRLLGRELLGDPSGVHLTSKPSIPKPMSRWLRLSGRGNAVDDFEEWREKILIDSFGPRKFLKWPISSSDIYSPSI